MHLRWADTQTGEGWMVTWWSQKTMSQGGGVHRGTQKWIEGVVEQ